MKIDLKQVTVNSNKVLDRLTQYCERVSEYNSYDPFGLVRIFVNKDNDFTAFESIDYNLQFTSNAHKLLETISCPTTVKEVPFREFLEYLHQLQHSREV